MMRELQCAEYQVPPSPNFKGDEYWPLEIGQKCMVPESQNISKNNHLNGHADRSRFLLVTGPQGQYHLGQLPHEKAFIILIKFLAQLPFMTIIDRVGEAKRNNYMVAV